MQVLKCVRVFCCLFLVNLKNAEECLYWCLSASIETNVCAVDFTMGFWYDFTSKSDFSMLLLLMIIWCVDPQRLCTVEVKVQTFLRENRHIAKVSRLARKLLRLHRKARSRWWTGSRKLLWLRSGCEKIYEHECIILKIPFPFRNDQGWTRKKKTLKSYEDSEDIREKVR